MSEIDIHKIVAKVIEMAQAQGADHSEAYLLQGNQISIQLEDSSIVKANNRTVSGIGLRILVGKAVGLASSSQFKSSQLKGMVKDAVSLARASEPDPAVVGLAEPTETYPDVSGLFDAELAKMDSGALVELAIAGLNGALERDPSINVSGSVTVSITNSVIANSNGINVESPRTSIQIYLTNKITKDDDIGVGYEFGLGRSLSSINPEEIGRKATDKAFSMLGAKKIESDDYPFLLDERAARNTLRGILSRGISAHEIDQGTAFFSDRLGEEIANSVVTVVDNPLEEGGISSRAFDDEGTPCQKLVLVENGTLLTYLSDVYTSHKLNIPNTGSASKNTYAGIPHPSLRQIQIQAGDASREELFEELGTGLYLENSLFARGGTSISQQVDVGYWVEKGEIKFPVKNTMLGTTVYDVLKNVKLVGKDLLVEAGLKSPMILFGPTKFSGGK